MLSLQPTSEEIAYYYICHTKLWYYHHRICLEHSHENVKTGKTIHESSFKRKQHEVMIGDIPVDMLGEELHEIKKRKSMRRAALMQAKYMLMISGKQKAVIHYYQDKKTETITLTREDRKELEEALKKIVRIVSRENPPAPRKKNYCRNCSYYEICFG